MSRRKLEMGKRPGIHGAKTCPGTPVSTFGTAQGTNLKKLLRLWRLLKISHRVKFYLSFLNILCEKNTGKAMLSGLDAFQSAFLFDS